ncbi:MAG: transpeptidase family protein [Desulfuromonas sp.]|nr:transpeptidase family protein [Desulfuromonas sp.]
MGGCFVAVYLMLLGRAFYLQVMTAEQWQQRASNQHKKTISLTPQRGAIYDRHGEPLAISLEADSVYVNPAEAKKILVKQEQEREKARAGGSKEKLEKIPQHSVDSIAASLAEILHLPSDRLLAMLERNKKFIWVKRRISSEQSTQLKALELPGVHYIREHERWYPNGRVAGQVLGFSGTDNEGLEGIERRYNGLIAGDGSYLTMQADGGRRSIGSGRQVFNGRLGKDIYLTIDTQIQFIAEKELAVAVKDAGARAGTALVMDPYSGEILALASYPDYDPNAFGKFRASARRNRGICDTFEPGSTFKLFLMAAALDSGSISLKDQVDCGRGSYKVGGKVIHDHRPLGRLSVSDVLKHSSNIGCAKIAQNLGKENFYSYLKQFGFGDKTDIDFDGEGRGILRPPQRWFEIDLAAISFGQGVTVTALQLATATSAIVNGGELMRPHLVTKVIDKRNAVEEQRRPYPVRRVIGRDVALAMRNIMVTVTDVDGTGSRARVPGFEVGGKTGTAQKVDPVTGTYSVDKRVSSFVGFAPARDPKLVVLVTLDEPQGKAYGGLLAAPVFSRIVEQSLRYLRIPASQGDNRIAQQIIESMPTEVPHVPVLLAERVAQLQGAEVMPDCRGLTSRQVLELMEQSGLNMMIKGAGRVVDQFPAPGRAIDTQSVIWVQLQPPQ